MSQTPRKRDKAIRWLQSPIRALDEIFPSLSIVPPTISPYKPGQQPTSSAPQKESSNLMKALKLLKSTSGAVPGLKATVEILIYCFDNVSDMAQNRQEYQELAEAIAQNIQTLSSYIERLGSSPIGQRVQTTISALNRQAWHVSVKQARSGMMRRLDAEEDVEDLMRLYRHIGVLIQQLQNDATLSIWNSTNESLKVASEHFAITRLQGLLPVLAARYDSTAASQVHRTGCTPNTRELVLQELVDWANDPEGAKVYWMNGMAGTGKTTIAYSFCSLLEATDQLAASFFCSQSQPDCRDVARIFPTIAYQLAQFCPPFQEKVFLSLANDPDVGTRGIGRQFEKLIYEPMRQLDIAIPNGLLVVVVDALDECSDRESAKAILNLLLKPCNELPVKFFFTCRPDQRLLDMVTRLRPDGGPLYHLHNIELNMVQDDIKTYLTAKLESVDVSDGQIKRLTELSGRLFIYAATIVRYLMNDKASVDRQKRLKAMLEMESSSHSVAHKPIDRLYTAVLADVLEGEDLEDTETKTIRVVLDTVVCAKEPLSVLSLACLTRRGPKEVASGLDSLLSVLHMDERTGLVSTLHASFHDYMLDGNRSGRFFCNQADRSNDLARQCFRIMRDLLRFNICELESSFDFDHLITDLSDRVDEAIPQHLFYACKYWGDHLFESRNAEKLSKDVEDFLSRRVLFWTEVLNLKNATKTGVAVLSNLNGQIEDLSLLKDLQALSRDAQKFVAVIGANAVCKSTPHIYTSVLALWDTSAPIWRHYGARADGLAKKSGVAIASRGAASLAIWRSTQGVYTLSISRDGRYIASGGTGGWISIWDAHTGEITVGPFDGHHSDITQVSFAADGHRVSTSSRDNTVRVWDTQTGRELVQSIKRHTCSVWAIDYSSDGSYLASGSHENHVYIWAALTGDLVTGPLEGHSDSVMSVSFAPNCKHIASGSLDRTIRCWDIQTGLLLYEPLKGHKAAVTSVTCSPAGHYIASGSKDHTIRIWDAYSGRLFGQPFHGHTDAVRCVSYSSSGNLLVSGSQDRTVRVWDAHSGHTVAGPFTGHTKWVYSVAFMPSDDRVVSCSSDQTIRIWDARALCSPASSSDAHTGKVNLVAFSPDSKYIASGGEDRTVRVWDAQSGRMRGHVLRGHDGKVWSVAYSCDGRIASGSADRTIRIWDANTGNMVGQPHVGHTHEVNSVAFAPDGARFASGSDDCTIRVWDVESGDAVGHIFIGHVSLVYSVAFSSDGRRIASCSQDKTIRIWDAHTGETCAGPFTFRWVSGSIAYSGDGTQIVFSSNKADISVCDAKTGEIVIDPCKGHKDWIHSAVFTHNGHIISGSADSTIRVWHAQSGKLIVGPIYAHTNWVKSIACSPDGHLFVSASHDGSIRIWNWLELMSEPKHDLSWWTVNEDGWVVGHDSSLLFWVPPDLRTGLKSPQCMRVIHEQGEWELDFRGAYIGREWTGCFA